MKFKLTPEVLIVLAMISILILVSQIKSCNLERECIKRNNCKEMGIYR